MLPIAKLALAPCRPPAPAAAASCSAPPRSPAASPSASAPRRRARAGAGRRAPTPCNPFEAYCPITDRRPRHRPLRRSSTWARAPTTASRRWSLEELDADWDQMRRRGRLGQPQALRQPRLGRRRARAPAARPRWPPPGSATGRPAPARGDAGRRGGQGMGRARRRDHGREGG